MSVKAQLTVNGGTLLFFENASHCVRSPTFADRFIEAA
ncbi:hypothetical protein K788_0005062 (plasmid) [Paraburkholderia caribensis MBA4]|uniref:Uncharacterized protein n=1 Tax=Paraburkholderia caribensis MBA4 TaxID=1323664 RepID=A0A0N7JVK3_9BURK|nr:hypothetical protein K788_0005062 [Paraburkholderia caribensis MBA4]